MGCHLYCDIVETVQTLRSCALLDYKDMENRNQALESDHIAVADVTHCDSSIFGPSVLSHMGTCSSYILHSQLIIFPEMQLDHQHLILEFSD